ncbi:MAG: D-glycero-beta-D-manno-heptose 1-phosphate adenylyltransferase [Sphingobacteriales bacterium]|nr:MAG: D-glycero-beta-D-manno-heptose 1-phosphate adenylyltransferase [Sphingobacteriales bacterium]
MKHTVIIQQKIFSLSLLQKEVNRWRFLQKKIAFTNGCFDILHEGHIFSLSAAAKEADILIVGLNSDASTRRLKGDSRPINNQHSRALLLASLIMIDAVVIFDEDTPQNLITTLMPDVLVKGGDYTVQQVVGATEVIANGGRVVINNIVDGFSTTGLIAKIQQL